ncbi:MAG: OmpA family protein [Desulfotalea sp.]
MQSKNFSQLQTASSQYWVSNPLSKAYEELHKSLAINNGFTVLIGEEGVGKTVLSELFKEGISVGSISLIISGKNLSERDFFHVTSNGYRIEGPCRNRMQFIINFSGFLYKCQENHQPVILVVDDCQYISQQLLDLIRHIGNIERGGQRLLNLFLLARPSFTEIINSPVNSTFKLSCANKIKLNNLDRQETSAYITHCLTKVGCVDRVFCLNGLELIHRASAGVVAKINLLCEKVLADLPAGETVPMAKIYSTIDSLGFTVYQNLDPELPDMILNPPEEVTENILVENSEKAELHEQPKIEKQLEQPDNSEIGAVKKGGRKKVIIFLILIFSLVAVGYGGYRFKQVADETVGATIIESELVEPDKKPEFIVNAGNSASDLEEISESTTKKESQKVESSEIETLKQIDSEKNSKAAPTNPSFVGEEKTPLKQEIVDEVEEPLNQKVSVKPAGDLVKPESRVEVVVEPKETEAILPETSMTFVVPLQAGDEYLVTLDGRRVLNKFSAMAEAYPDSMIIVRGYVSSNNDSPENDRISLKRADNMAKRLVENGLDRARIQTIGMGVKNPVASNRNQAGRNKNRRVELEVSAQDFKSL